MDFQFKVRLAVVIQLLSALVLFQNSNGHDDCNYPAIFNFGDSNSDTAGNFKRADCPLCCKTWVPPSLPRGVCLRLSDGRLIIDFIAQKLGWLYLPGYAKDPRYEEDYSHGVNFAVTGIGVVGPGDLKLFRNGTIQLKDKAHLPPQDAYSKALYTIDIGHNNVAGILWELINESTPMSPDEKDKEIANVTKAFGQLVKGIYELGGRTFWIHNVGPLGCLTCVSLVKPLDEVGCSKFFNDVVQEFNKNLKNLIHQLRLELKDASIVFVDVYTAKYSLFQNATTFGFKDPFIPCINKDACSKPKESILFDCAHFTEAANEIVARNIMDGSYSDPQVSLTKACTLSVSSKTEL